MLNTKQNQLSNDVSKQICAYGIINEWTFVNKNFLQAEVKLPIIYSDTNFSVIAAKGINSYVDANVLIATEIANRGNIAVYLQSPSGEFTSDWNHINDFSVSWITCGKI